MEWPLSKKELRKNTTNTYLRSKDPGHQPLAAPIPPSSNHSHETRSYNEQGTLLCSHERSKTHLQRTIVALRIQLPASGRPESPPPRIRDTSARPENTQEVSWSCPSTRREKRCLDSLQTIDQVKKHHPKVEMRRQVVSIL